MTTAGQNPALRGGQHAVRAAHAGGLRQRHAVLDPAPGPVGRPAAAGDAGGAGAARQQQPEPELHPGGHPRRGPAAGAVRRRRARRRGRLPARRDGARVLRRREPPERPPARGQLRGGGEDDGRRRGRLCFLSAVFVPVPVLVFFFVIPRALDVDEGHEREREQEQEHRYRYRYRRRHEDPVARRPRRRRLEPRLPVAPDLGAPGHERGRDRVGDGGRPLGRARPLPVQVLGRRQEPLGEDHAVRGRERGVRARGQLKRLIIPGPRGETNERERMGKEGLGRASFLCRVRGDGGAVAERVSGRTNEWMDGWIERKSSPTNGLAVG